MCVIILNTVSFALVAEGLYPLRENLLPHVTFCPTKYMYEKETSLLQ